MTDGPDGDRSRETTVELGVELLERLEHAELSVAEAVDRIEAITTDPTLTRAILERAEKRGVIDRDGGTVRPNSGVFLRFESEVVVREGEFTCERCGAGLSTGHFIGLGSGEVGPFGSSCIRKVTGRE
ncbi:MarR family transcriptional regulator [Halobacteriales archaeon SW_7_68_16]|nr:MAG: MarR family transcriptional regulator [Halobacteriales archaeon SW_7_68_16]